MMTIDSRSLQRRAAKALYPVRGQKGDDAHVARRTAGDSRPLHTVQRGAHVRPGTMQRIWYREGTRERWSFTLCRLVSAIFACSLLQGLKTECALPYFHAANFEGDNMSGANAHPLTRVMYFSPFPPDYLTNDSGSTLLYRGTADILVRGISVNITLLIWLK